MKKTLLLILAFFAVAIAMPAQAGEVSGDYRPGYLIAVDGDVIGPKVTDDKVTTCRCMWSQLEAADYIIDNKVSYADDESIDTVAGRRGYGVPYEVGWRNYNA